MSAPAATGAPDAAEPTPALGIHALDTRDRAQVEAVARLHAEFLSDSPVALMGPRFVREFYYVDLVDDGLIQCITCRDESGVLGFLSYTDIPDDFMARGFRRHWLKISWIMLKSLIAKPSMLTDLLFVLKLMRTRAEDSDQVDKALGEALSMAVPPRHQKFKPPGGKGRMTVRFFETMVEWFRSRGIERIRFQVKPDNKAANLFYSTIGCRFEKRSYAGVAIHRYTYEIPADPGAGAE